ncbi:MAG TPA: DUF1189 family protein, partial [Anaerolinea sp.]|nr:DUF1189 family protein [Anaerolinea sp.]
GIVAALTTAGVTRGLLSVTDDIRNAFTEGRVPEITISGGLASVRGPQPAILIDQDNVFIAVDTTGKLTGMDGRRYTSGVLLTRTELVVLNRDELQRLPLTQLNELFQRDPLVINAETTARFWQGFSVWFSLLALLGLLLWDVVVRLLYLAVVALPVFGIVSLFRRAPYGGALSVGVFAFVPALIADYILGRFGVRFFLMQTLLLLVFWGVGMYAVLVPNGWDLLGPDRPLRGWRAWLGLPLLAVLALDVIFRWPNGNLINLIAAAVTGIVLVGASMLSLPKRDEEETPPHVANT